MYGDVLLIKRFQSWVGFISLRQYFFSELTLLSLYLLLYSLGRTLILFPFASFVLFLFQ